MQPGALLVVEIIPILDGGKERLCEIDSLFVIERHELLEQSLTGRHAAKLTDGHRRVHHYLIAAEE